jgi:hypothetical protein
MAALRSNQDTTGSPALPRPKSHASCLTAWGMECIIVWLGLPIYRLNAGRGLSGRRLNGFAAKFLVVRPGCVAQTSAVEVCGSSWAIGTNGAIKRDCPSFRRYGNFASQVPRTSKTEVCGSSWAIGTNGAIKRDCPSFRRYGNFASQEPRTSKTEVCGSSWAIGTDGAIKRDCPSFRRYGNFASQEPRTSKTEVCGSSWAM